MFYVFLSAFSSFSEWFLAFEHSICITYSRTISEIIYCSLFPFDFTSELPNHSDINSPSLWKLPVLFVCHIFTTYSMLVKLKWILSVQEVEEVFQECLSMYLDCSVLETGFAASILTVKGTVPAPSSFHPCWKQRNGGSITIKQNEIWISTA